MSPLLNATSHTREAAAYHSFVVSVHLLPPQVGPLSINLLALSPDGRLADPTVAPTVLVPPSAHGPALDPAAPGGFAFPGFWWPDGLPLACWGGGGTHLWFTSLWGSRPTAFRLRVADGCLQRVAPERLGHSAGTNGHEKDGSVVVLAALRPSPNLSSGGGNSGGGGDPAGSAGGGVGVDGGALVAWSTPAHPGGVAVVAFRGEGPGAALVASCAPCFGRQSVTRAPFAAAAAATSGAASAPASATAAAVSPPLGLSWQVVSVVPPDSTTGVPIEGILVVPPPRATDDAAASKPLGLIVVPHGGPHSATPTGFMAPYAYLALETYCAVKKRERERGAQLTRTGRTTRATTQMMRARRTFLANKRVLPIEVFSRGRSFQEVKARVFLATSQLV